MADDKDKTTPVFTTEQETALSAVIKKAIGEYAAENDAKRQKTGDDKDSKDKGSAKSFFETIGLG